MLTTRKKVIDDFFTQIAPFLLRGYGKRGKSKRTSDLTEYIVAYANALLGKRNSPLPGPDFQFAAMLIS